jgi:hypothetical protein
MEEMSAEQDSQYYSTGNKTLDGSNFASFKPDEFKETGYESAV